MGESKSHGLIRIVMIGTAPETKGGVASVIRVYEKVGLFDEWPITYLASHADGGFFRKLSKATIAFSGFLFQLIFRRDFVLHVHSASRASFWRKAAFIYPCLWMGTPVIFHLHGGGFMHFYHDECGPFSRSIIRNVLNRSAKIVVLSESWRESVSALTDNSELIVIANPCMPFEERDDLAARTPGVVLFMGRMVESKGFFVLLRAFARVVKSFPEARLICAGDGDLKLVDETIRSLGISNHVDILGWIDEDTRSDLLARASIFALPSFAEGLPMSVIEAMSAGIPVVATPVGGIPEVVRNHMEGILVPLADEKELAQAIEKLVENRELTAELGKNARDRFNSNFSAEVVIPKLESVYLELGVSPKAAVS